MSDAYFYAQIDANNIVIGVSQLSGEVVAAHMIPLTSYDASLLGNVHRPDGTFVKPTPPPPSLSDAKATKLAELRAARDAAIYSSFTSTALGTVKTYNYSKSAYDDFGRETSLLAIDPTITSIDWYTVEDAKLVSHTRDQFVQVIKDGAAHERTLKVRYITLEAQVNAATSIADVGAIIW